MTRALLVWPGGRVEGPMPSGDARAARRDALAAYRGDGVCSWPALVEQGDPGWQDVLRLAERHRADVEPEPPPPPA